MIAKDWSSASKVGTETNHQPHRHSCIGETNSKRWYNQLVRDRAENRVRDAPLRRTGERLPVVLTWFPSRAAAEGSERATQEQERSRFGNRYRRRDDFLCLQPQRRLQEQRVEVFEAGDGDGIAGRCDGREPQ